MTQIACRIPLREPHDTHEAGTRQAPDLAEKRSKKKEKYVYSYYCRNITAPTFDHLNPMVSPKN
jgi:hypothetical protein